MHNWIGAFILFISCIAYGEEGPYFLTILVDNRQLDYSTPGKLLKSMAKHPSDGSKNSDVGHCWIMVEGPGFLFEGGFTGEAGEEAPTYLAGVGHLLDIEDPNPGRYLFEAIPDGHFEPGSGGHMPTVALQLEIENEKYLALQNYLKTYPFSRYSLSENNCVTFVLGALEIAGFSISCQRRVELPPIFWTDPRFQWLTFDCPDLLEAELKRLQQAGVGRNVLLQYQIRRQESWIKRLHRTFDDFVRLPQRTLRWIKTWGI